MAIPLMKVHLPSPEELMPALQETLYSGFISEGVKVKEFEEKFQQKFNLGIRPLSVNSGTSALQLAYRCAGVRNKLVLATPMTCTATNMPIFAEGGRIVWCDIDPETGNISASDVEKKLKKYGSQVAAISFVDFAGYPADINKLMDLACKYDIPMIEDAAQSLGAKYHGYNIGADPGVSYVCFSFQAIKHLTTIDGGMLVVNVYDDFDDHLWNLAKKLKWYGINREAAKEATRWHYDIPDWGYKFHMNNVGATIGISQLNHIDKIVRRHIENGRFFDEKLKNIPDMTLMKIPYESEPSYWIYMVKVERRDDFAKMMTDAGIGVNVAHIRNDLYTCFKDKTWVENVGEELPGLKEFNDKYIAIPCGWWVTDEDRNYIVETIKKGW